MVHSDSDDSIQNSPKGIDFDDLNESLVQRFAGLPERDFYYDDFFSYPEDNCLEWDVEIDESENEDFINLENDPWSSLYVWYANILSETASLLSEKPCADNIDGVDRFGCSAMHYAASEGHVEVLNLILQAGTYLLS